MARGNNRAGQQNRAHFRLAGGSIITFRHPYFAGQIDTSGTGVDEIDISAAVKLEDKFFSAQQNQDSAKQVVLVDGSTVTICNNLLNGTITFPAIRTTGLVCTGDFIAACQLIKSVGDSVGGLIFKTDFINGKALTKMFYGVTVKNCPDDESQGNDVPVYNVQLFYAGWIEAISTSIAQNKKRIWSIGVKQGLEAYFSPYGAQNATGTTGSQNNPISTANSGIPESNFSDDTSPEHNADNTDGATEGKVFDGTWAGGKVIEGASPITP